MIIQSKVDVLKELTKRDQLPVQAISYLIVFLPTYTGHVQKTPQAHFLSLRA
jgi:hypothetical protein